MLIAAIDLNGDGKLDSGDAIGEGDCPVFPPRGAERCTVEIRPPLGAPP